MGAIIGGGVAVAAIMVGVVAFLLRGRLAAASPSLLGRRSKISDVEEAGQANAEPRASEDEVTLTVHSSRRSGRLVGGLTGGLTYMDSVISACGRRSSRRGSSFASAGDTISNAQILASPSSERRDMVRDKDRESQSVHSPSREQEGHERKRVMHYASI